MEGASKKRKKVVLTIKEKIDLCNRLERGENRNTLMKEYCIGSSTLYDIRKQKNELLKFCSAPELSSVITERRVLRKPKFDELDTALYEWFTVKRSEGTTVSGPMLIEKAKELYAEMQLAEECAFSDGWLAGFKNRHGIRKLDMSGSLASRVEQTLVDVKTEMPDTQEMAVAGPSSADTAFMDAYPQRGAPRPTNWTVPQQAPPGTKPTVAPSPPVKKTLPLVSQPSPKPVIAKPAPPRPVSPPQPPPPPPEVCLRWNSYHSNMQATFPSLLNNEQFVDVTLACEGRSIKCHKVMLSACSSYFEELLSQNPCQHPIVLMKDLKFWEVQALVDFMYRGEVNVGQDKLPSLLAAAEALQIKGLAGPASTSSSHDEDSLPPTLPLATDDYMDESASSSSSARRARKRRTIASLPTPRQNTISPHRNPVGRPRLIRPSPQPSTSTYHQTSVASEPPLRRARRSEPASLPVGEIKIEPVDIDISNDSIDPVDDGFDINKTYDGSGGGGGGNANDSSRQADDVGVDTGGGGKRELTGNLSDDNKAITSGHDSDHMDYSSNNGNNGMNCEPSVTAAGGGSKAEVQGYSYAERNADDPGMSSSDMNPTYPEVVLKPGADSASSDSILGHL